MDSSEQLTTALAGRYIVEREIGAGGMATVYLARDVRHSRPVALKVLKPELGAVLGVDRFLAEIKVTANLQHPNLLPLFDSGEADGLLFYVMPYVDGESLRARLSREKQLPVNEAIRLAVSIASALDYAHRHGVIHRDLKPENILLHEGQPLVADFGIALAVSNAGGNRITQTGLSLGTPQYMSPEQATGDRVIDARTDVYSLAAVLYEMLTGDPPHMGSTAQAVIARVLTEKPRSVRASRDSVPANVDRAIERALAKLPADRWASAHEFALALAREETDSRSVATESAASVSAPRVSLRTAASRAKAWAIPLVGVALGAAGADWLAVRHPESDSPVRYVLTSDGAERFIDNRGVPLALSPDGKLLVFTGEANGRRSLFVRPLIDLHARELRGTDEAMQPFFSPDGKWVGYYAGSQVRKIPVNGGPSVLVTEATGFWGASWYTNDEIVISMEGTLAAVSASGGKPRVFARPDSSAPDIQMRYPFVLANGKTVLYTAFGPNGVAVAQIGAASLDAGTPRTLDLIGTDPVAVIDGHLIYSSAAGAIMSVAFDERRAKVLATPEPVVDGVVVGEAGPLKGAVSRSGSLVYESGSAARRIMLGDPHGQLRPIIAEPGRYDHPRLSPDEKQLAFEVSTGTENSIYIFDIPSATLARLTTGTSAFFPEWSHDGKRVIFSSSNVGARRSKLSWQPADRSGPAEVLYQSSRTSVHDGALSSDGSTLVLALAGANSVSDLAYRQLRGDTTTRELVSSRVIESAPRISPDGKWVAYNSDESGRFQVYVTPLPGPGGRVQISTNGGAQPVWSADGGRLFYANNGALWATTLSFSPSVRVESREKLLDGVTVGPPNHAAYDVARDGKHFVLLQNAGAEAQLIVVHDWKDELRASIARTAR